MTTNSPTNTLKTLKIIHWAVTGGPMIFAIVVIFIISSSGKAQIIDLDNILSFMPIGFGVVLIAVSSFVSKATLKENLKDKTELAQKLVAFQSSHIVKMAMLEGAALFAITGSFVTYTYANLSVICVILPIMILSQPTVFSIIEALELSPEESRSLES